MTRESIEVTRQDRIYCLKASSDYHSEVCEECRLYPNCDHMTQDDMTELTIKDLETLEQEPQTGHCKNCKWWKDSDGLYRRGGHAESQCPINRREVFEGNGYCYMFDPQEDEE